MTAEPRDVELILRDLAHYDGFMDPMCADRLVADVGPLLDRLAAADRENAELRGEVERLEARIVRADEVRRRIERARDDACAKVGRVELMHVWTNEDGRRFVFADDLAKALGLPV